MKQMSQELQDAIQECREVLERNRKIFYFTDHCEYSYYDAYNKLNEFTFTSQSMDHIDNYIYRKIIIGENFTDSEAIGIVNKYTSHNLIPFKLLQIENPMNLQNAKDAGTYEETDDVIYWWDEDKEDYNDSLHDISFEDAIGLINYDEDLRTIVDMNDDDNMYTKVYLIKTIVDNNHDNSSKYKTIGGTFEHEKNFVRYVLYFDDILDPVTVKIVYNVRYSQLDNKLVIKFVTVYEDNRIPVSVKNLRAQLLRNLGVNLSDLNEHKIKLLHLIDDKENNDMKFKRKRTNEIIDLSDRDPDTITLNEIRHCSAVDIPARRLKIRLVSQENKKRYDYDKIIPIHEEIMDDGIWASYYMEKPLDDLEWKRREKYYDRNREVFNKCLDQAREANPNFIKFNKELYTIVKEAICYGAPQRLVRNTMRLLFNEDVLPLLPLEDPEDAILDKNIDKWKMTYSDWNETTIK